MAIYTYVVDHKDKAPAVGADTMINGDKVTAVMFDDAMAKLKKYELLLDEWVETVERVDAGVYRDLIDFTKEIKG